MPHPEEQFTDLEQIKAFCHIAGVQIIGLSSYLCQIHTPTWPCEGWAHSSTFVEGNTVEAFQRALRRLRGPDSSYQDEPAPA